MIDIMNLLLCIIGVVVVVEATSSSFLIQDGSSVKAFSKRYSGRNLALSPATCWKDCLPLKPPSCVRQCQGRKRKRRERCVEDCKPIRKKEHVAFKLCQKNCRTAVVRAKLARVAPPETASAADGRLAAQPDPTAEEDPGVKVEEKVVKTEDEHEIEELEKEEAEAIREGQIEEIEKKEEQEDGGFIGRPINSAESQADCALRCSAENGRIHNGVDICTVECALSNSPDSCMPACNMIRKEKLKVCQMRCRSPEVPTPPAVEGHDRM